MAVTEMHEERNTFEVDINLPGHDPRGAATALFSRSRKALIEREGGKCWLSGLGADVLGPLEAHHYPVERCFAEAWTGFAFRTTASSATGVRMRPRSTGTSSSKARRAAPTASLSRWTRTCSWTT